MLVTGAGGFIGRSTVAAATDRGHRVRALLRPGSSAPDWSNAPGIDIVHADLREPDTVGAVVRDVDVVIHLAAAMSGGLETQMATTVGGTRHLLDAMVAAGLRRIVLISSIAVYDVTRAGANAPVDESCALESCPEERDAYARAKLAQEALIHDSVTRYGLDALILRPGVVYGPGRLWSPRIGLRVTPRTWLIPRPAAPLPVTFVGNCADAIVLAAERSEVNGIALNIVDDSSPARVDYADRIRHEIAPRPWVLPVPWFAVRFGCAVARALAAIIPGTRAVSDSLSPRRLAARFTPRPYSNTRIKDRLGWSPRVSLGDSSIGSG